MILSDAVSMIFIKYKKLNNRWYVYEVTSMWDKALKQPRSLSKYLGPADPKTSEMMPFVKKRRHGEKSILDFEFWR